MRVSIPVHSMKIKRRYTNTFHSVGGIWNNLTPTPVLKALEIEPTEERARLEVSALAEAKGKLEDEIRKVNELLKAREKEVVHRDATIQRLEREKDEVQITEVS